MTTIRTACAVLSAFLTSGAIASAGGFPDYGALRNRAEQLWTGSDGAGGTSVVLLPEGSPLRKAAETFAKYRDARIIAFDPARPEGCLESLIRGKARWATVFVEPKDMDVNLVRKLVVLSTLLDEDPFCDMAFGFVTGATPAKAEAFVARIIDAGKNGVEPYAASMSMSNISFKYADSPFLQGMGGEAWYVKEGDKKFAFEAMEALGKAGFVDLGGCGDPEGIWMFDDQRNMDETKHWPFDPQKVGQDPKGEMPRLTAEDFRALKLRNAVVWTHVCHQGSVERMWVEGDIVSTFGHSDVIEEYRIPKGRSIALAILEAGASAYMAPLGPNFGMQKGVELAIAGETGMPLGDVMRRGYHDIVMDTEGHIEKIGLFAKNLPAFTNVDGFTNNNSPHNRCLYGDPLFAPLAGRKSPPTVQIDAKEADKGARIVFRVAASQYVPRTWYGNRGEDSGRGRIYETIDLPRPVEAAVITGVRAIDKDGKPFRITKKTALLERIDGKTVLHLQILTDNSDALEGEGALVEAIVELRPRAGGK